jgi:phytoene dehydrogenase-like protein
VSYDIVFLGSSPNALAAAARLSRSGLRVLVLESRSAVGGPVATEAFAPGFSADTGVMSAALDPEIVKDLDLAIEPMVRGSVTWLGAESVTFREAPALPPAVSHAVELLRAMYRMSPPSVPAAAGVDVETLVGIGARLLGLGAREMHEVLRLSFMSARDYFGEQAALSEPAQALLCAAAVRGLSEGPFAPGTLWNYLHHEAVGDGLFRSTVKGGVNGLASALADKARCFGAEIRTDAGVSITVDVTDGVARGVILPGGERVEAAAVVSDHDARATFTQFVPPYELEPEDNRAIRAIRSRGSVARVHLALRVLPDFTNLSAEALRGTLVFAPSVVCLEKAWDQAKRGALPDRPLIEATVPTLSDPSLAPEGAHVLSAWVQYVPMHCKDARSVFETVVGALAEFAPNLPELVLHSEVLLPEDLERRFGLTGGHLYGGETNLAQSFFLRPLPGYAFYESPIANLYLCGSAAHPAGYSGRSGWNFAARLLARRP